MVSSASTGALAPRSIIGSENKVWLFPVLAAFGIALITLSAKIQVPFWPVPMTLQTAAVAAIAAAYGLRLGVATVISYLAAGYFGLPVFAGPVAGPLYLVGPTAGFLAGFLVMAVIVGFVADRVRSENFIALLAIMFVANVILFTLGFSWLGYGFVTSAGETLGASYAWTKGVEPFILGGIVKMILAAAAVSVLSKFMKS